ncbi:MAG: hypothetical protein ACRDJW_17920 [Thermomicrobiales bacterium]
MYAQPTHDGSSPQRPSRVIAEALVGRHGPTQIVARAAALGISRQLTQVIVCACTSTAIDDAHNQKRNAIAAP